MENVILTQDVCAVADAFLPILNRMVLDFGFADVPALEGMNVAALFKRTMEVNTLLLAAGISLVLEFPLIAMQLQDRGGAFLTRLHAASYEAQALFEELNDAIKEACENSERERERRLAAQRDRSRASR